MSSQPITVPDALAASGAAEGEGAPGVALRQALEGLGGQAGLVLAFPSGIDAGEAASELQSEARGAPVVGLTGNGSIGSSGAIVEGCSVLALAAGTRTGVGVTHSAARGLHRAARHATAEALQAVGPAPEICLILILDTRSGDQAEAVAGAYAAAGAGMPIIGGAAGGRSPAQIAGGLALTDSVIAVAIASDLPPGLAMAHGCRAIGAPAIATRSNGRILTELDGRPAATVYLERMGYAGVDLGKEEFEALAVTHPLAQPELSGESRLRHVLGRAPAGGLECATHIPSNAAIEFTHQTPEDIVEASGRAVEQALAGLGAPPRAALIFDCAGRKRAVGGALDLEVQGLLDAFGLDPPPLAGLFTHGEIFRVRGAKGDRNHAVVVAAFG